MGRMEKNMETTIHVRISVHLGFEKLDSEP